MPESTTCEGFEKRSDDPNQDKADPTRNVVALVAAGFHSVRNLRMADQKYYDKVLADSEKLSEQGRNHLEKMAALRAEFGKDVRHSDLVVAAQTRLVDVAAQAASAASIATAVLALQNTTDRNAETLRTTLATSNAALAKQVVDSAQAIAQQTATANAAMDARVGTIERTIAQGVGRQSIADPQMTMLVGKLDKLIPIVAATGGVVQGKDDSWKFAALLITIIVGVGGLLVAIYNISPRTETKAPQIVYVPEPPAKVEK